MASSDPLDLHSLRKEQRRVAALLQADADPPKSHKRRRKPLAPDIFRCSHLDPEGKHRNPAWNYLKEAFTKNPKMTLDDLRKGFHYVKDKNEELFTPRKDKLQEGILKKRKNDKLASKSVDFDEKAKHRDREKEYQNLRRDVSQSLDGLQLPNIAHNNRVGKKPEPEDEVDDERERMHVRLPKIGDEARDNYPSPEFSKGRPKRYGKGRSQFRKGRKVRGKRVSYEGDSAVEDMTSDEEYPQDPLTQFSDSGKAESDFYDHDPYLRYTHGRNPVGEDFMARRIREEGNAMIRIKSFENSFCSCCGSDHHNQKPCPECKRVESHSKKCSRRSKKDRGKSKRKGDQGRETPPTLISEASQRCLKCGKLIRRSRDASNVSSNAGFGRSWSRDSSESSGSYRLMRSRSESRESRPRSAASRDGVSRSRSASPVRQKRKKTQKELVPKKNSDILDDLERKLREGVFDYDVNVRMVDEIDQTIRIPGVAAKTNQNSDAPSKPRSKVDIYRDAYVKALAVARSGNLPSEPWMLGNRTSKAFVYSYYHRIPRRRPRQTDGDDVQEEQEPYKLPTILKGRDAEMKMIFGKIKPDDFLPGGPRNPFEPNPLAYVKHERTRKPLSLQKMKQGKRRVQQVTADDVKNRKAKQ